MRFFGRPQEFRSLAKVVADGPRMFEGREGNMIDHHMVIIETIGSQEMRHRAQKRVKAQHPELQDRDVGIRVAKFKNDTVFNVLATAQEPNYTKLYLNALLDEFMTFKISVNEQAFEQSHQELINTLDQRISQSEEALKKLQAVRKESENSKLENGNGSVSSVMLTHLKDAETSSANADAARAKAYANVEAAREKFKTKTPRVAVLERATTASENIEDWTLPISVGVLGGGLVGTLLGMLIAMRVPLVT